MRIRKRTFITFTSILVIIIAVGLWFITWSKAANEGTISAPITKNIPVTYTDKSLSGTYVGFSYSGKYTIRDEVAKDMDIERHTLTADTRYDKRILVSVSNGQLSTNGAYIFRQHAPNQYASRNVPAGNGTAEVWVKKDGTEQTAFIVKGDKVAMISFVTANTSEDLTSETNALLTTFKWEK